MSTPPVVAVIHATPASMGPVTSAFAAGFPDADLWHLLDDRLDRDAAAAGGLTPPLAGRMKSLVQYAVDAGADAVQLACSMYAPVAGQVTQPVPVVASDQGMFDEVARLDPRTVLVLASLRPAAADSSQRLTASLDGAGRRPDVVTAVAEDARAAALAGDLDGLAAALVAAARSVPDVDVVALAQYSLSPAAAAVGRALGIPVLSGPHLAAAHLASRLGGQS